MDFEEMAARKAENGRSPQVTVTLSHRCHSEFEEVCEHLGLQPGTFIRQQLETYHESQEFASLLRRARKHGDWAEMIERVPPDKKDEAIAYLKSLSR